MKRGFLKWLLFVSLTSLGVVTAGVYGVTEQVIAQGWVSMSICGVITLLCLNGSLQCGYRLLKLPTREVKQGVRRAEFFAALCPNLGILGTVIGMMFMMGDIGSLDMTNLNLTEIAMSMGTALMTTAFGIAAQSILWVQLHIINQEG